jgi:hypothetical protein
MLGQIELEIGRLLCGLFTFVSFICSSFTHLPPFGRASCVLKRIVFHSFGVFHKRGMVVCH